MALSPTLKRQGIITSGQKVLQRRTGGRSEDGVDSITEIYRCNLDDIFTLLPAKDAVNVLNANLLCKSATWAGIGAGLAEYSAAYSGFAAGPSNIATAKPVYRLGYIQRTEPLNAHPDFETAIKTAIGATAYNESFDDQFRFVAISNSSSVAALRGASEYLDFGLAWQETRLEVGPPDSTKINRIYTTGQLPGPAIPAIPTGRNWLLTSIEGEQEGTVWRNVRTWVLSGRNGWSNLVYVNA
jgi:hypothetical protein